MRRGNNGFVEKGKEQTSVGVECRVREYMKEATENHLEKNISKIERLTDINGKEERG